MDVSNGGSNHEYETRLFHLVFVVRLQSTTSHSRPKSNFQAQDWNSRCVSDACCACFRNIFRASQNRFGLTFDHFSFKPPVCLKSTPKSETQTTLAWRTNRRWDFISLIDLIFKAVAMLAAVDDIIKGRQMEPSATAYFATLMMLLSERSGADAEEVGAMVYLLTFAFPRYSSTDQNQC